MMTATLESLVLDIVASAENGINHVDLVKAVHASGYEHHNKQLSTDVHEIVNDFIHSKVLRKNIETRKITTRRRAC